MKCTMPDCQAQQVSKQLCAKHYQRQRKHGDPSVVMKGGYQPGQQRKPQRPRLRIEPFTPNRSWRFTAAHWHVWWEKRFGDVSTRERLSSGISEMRELLFNGRA